MSDLLAVAPDSLVQVEVRPDGVATVRLDNPPVNALSIALVDDLARAAAALTRDPSVKAVVLTGEEQASWGTPRSCSASSPAAEGPSGSRA